MSRTVLKTACNRDCPDACGILATIEDGRVVRLQGDPDHPVTQGFLCKRTSRFLRRQYDPARVTEPLIRHRGQWAPIPIKEALDLAADRLAHFRSHDGPASILNYRCGGSMGIMKLVTDYFFQQFGPTTIKSGDVCAGAGDAAQEMDFGKADSNDLFDLENARTIVLWGKNVFVSHVHLIPILKEARRKGARLILIDPVPHRTRTLCDDYLQVAPGGDAALAFGVARWLADRGQLDPSAADWCDHYEEYMQLLHSRSLEQWATLSGVTPSDVGALAAAYVSGPSTILVGWGMQRRPNGAAIVRSIDALAAVTGNIGIPGGCVSFYFARKDAFDVSFVDPDSAPRAIPEPLLGPGIEAASDPPIRMVWVTAANPVAMLPDSDAVARALRDRFTVVVDSFLTDTADAAQLFLPTVTMLEESDLVGAYGHHFINELRPVTPAPDGVLSDYQIFQELARRLDMGSEWERDPDEWKRQLLAKSASQGVTLDTLRSGPTRNPHALPVVFAGRKFPTPSGKANLITSYSHPQPRLDSHFPLRLMALSTDEAQASQWQTSQQQGPAVVTVHPAAAAGLAEGARVRVQSALNEIPGILRFNEQLQADVILMDKGGWLSADRCANRLIPAECTDAGEGACYYDTPVRLVPDA